MKLFVHWSNYEGKPCVGMFSCVKVLCLYLAKEYHKENMLLVFVAFFSSMALNPLYHIQVIKLDFLVA